MNRSLKCIASLTLYLMFLVGVGGCSTDEPDMFGKIYGIVTDSETGDFMKAATVKLEPTGKTVTTGSEGQYEFTELTPQQYTVSVIKNNYVNEPKTVSVVAGQSSKCDIAIQKSLPILKVNTTELNFSDSDNMLVFEIMNTGAGTLEWEIKEDADWISVEPARGTTNKQVSTVTVKVDRRQISSDKEYSYTLNVASNGGSATVKVNVGAQQKIVADVSSLDFGSTKTTLYVTLANSVGNNMIHYSIKPSEPWLTASPLSGDAGKIGSKIAVTVDRTKMQDGKDYQAQLTIESSANEIVIPVSARMDAAGLSVSPNPLIFAAKDTEKSLTISRQSGTSNLSYTLSSNKSWVKLSKTAGVVGATSDNVVVTVDRSGLPVGTQKAVITATADGVTPVAVEVQVTVEAASLEVTPASLNFQAGDTEKSITISRKSGLNNLSYTLSSTQSWVKFSKTAGTVGSASDNVVVTVDRTNLPAGTSNATITVSADGVTSVNVPLSVVVEQMAIDVTPTSLSFGTDDTQKSLTIRRRSGVGNLSYTLSSDQSWVSFSRSSGSVGASDDQVTVFVNRAGQSAGVKNATIKVMASGANTVNVPVSMEVKETGGGSGEGGGEEDYSSATVTSCDSRIECKIVSCKHSGSSIVFEYTIENKSLGKDINDFRVYPVNPSALTVITNDQGVDYTYRNSHFTFGGKPSSSSNPIMTTLPMGIAKKGIITLDDSEDVKKLPLIKIFVMTYPKADYGLATEYVTFRNVPVF